MDTRIYLIHPYYDRKGKFHTSRIWKADFQNDVYVKGTLRRWKWRGHDGEIIEDDSDKIPSIYGIFRDI